MHSAWWKVGNVTRGDINLIHPILGLLTNDVFDLFPSFLFLSIQKFFYSNSHTYCGNVLNSLHPSFPIHLTIRRLFEAFFRSNEKGYVCFWSCKQLPKRLSLSSSDLYFSIISRERFFCRPQAIKVWRGINFIVDNLKP